MPLFKAIRTARLALEQIREEHADGMFDVLSDPRLYRYMVSEVPQSLSWLRERYRALAGGMSPNGSEWWLNWIVVPHGGGHRPVGYVQATVPAGLDHAQLGWTIGGAFQRLGYARESVRAVCDHFARNGVGEIRATIDVRNERSIALAEAVGFARVATVVSDDILDGVRGNDHQYVLRVGASAVGGA